MLLFRGLLARQPSMDIYRVKKKCVSKQIYHIAEEKFMEHRKKY
jgi:hypothetical protein